MKKIAMIAALPLAMSIAACSDPGGDDTADLAPDATAPGGAGTSEDIDAAADPMDDAMMADDTMTEDPMTEEPADTAEPMEEGM